VARRAAVHYPRSDDGCIRTATGMSDGRLGQGSDMGVIGVLLGLSASVVPVSDAAVEAALTAGYRRCMATGAAAEGVTSGIMDCLGAEIDRQDDRLNRTYRELMGRLPPARKTTLRNLQRAWIRQRDEGCAAEPEAQAGGSIAAITHNDCILRETTRRVIWLKGYRR
jgi:uncharacterized protein YecT (DUF1311 family)